MSRGLSTKVACVLAVVAFIAAFRVQAEAREGDPQPAAAPLSASRASALESDTVRTADEPAFTVRLSAVAALPKLHREPRAKVIARRKQERAERRARARKRASTARQAPRTTTPTAPRPEATPVATAPPVTPAPPAPQRSGGGYVGKDFDSEG